MNIANPHYLARGFTLVEMLITVTIIAIVAAFATPSFKSQIEKRRAVALSEDLAGAMQFARIEAVKRGARVSLCASSNGNSCSGSDNWSNGFIVVLDPVDSDNKDELPPDGSTVLRVWDKLGGGAKITAPVGTQYLRFVATGRLAVIKNKQSFLAQIEDCSRQGNARSVEIGVAGATSLFSADCS